MKKFTSKFVAAFLSVAMVVSCITPVSLAAPNNDSSKASMNEEIVLDDNTKSILEAAKAMASYTAILEDGFEVVSDEKAAVQEGILHNYEEETDLSDFEMKSDEMDQIVEEILEENHMEDTVEVSYETDEEDTVTTMTVEMDSMVAMAGEEASGLSAEDKEKLMAAYSEYMAFMQQNADYFGVQTPYFTNKDNVCPIGSLLAIAGIPNEYLAYGLDFIVENVMPIDQVEGVISLFHYANVFALQLKGADIVAAREAALKAVAGAKTDVQKHLLLTNWLAQWCTFDMPYIMEMQAPEVDTEDPMYIDKMTIYSVMYENIKGEVYNAYYQGMLQEGYPEELAAQYAEMMAKSYMDDPVEEDKENGSQSAMTLASSIINLWEGSHVGALAYRTAVCLGYSNAYVYLVQYLYDDIYRNADGTWKTYEQLNSGSEGSWDAIVDYTRITFNAEVTMYGVTQENFQSDHYWNAVKIDGNWYYVDPCYVDVYVEVMARDRVETNGNVNHLYFMFSHTAAAELYDGYYKELDTLYANVATDRTYEDAWFAFAKSPIYQNSDKYYYIYDSTDLIEMQNSNTLEQEDIVYKLVSKNCASSNGNDTAADYDQELIDFTNGQVYDPTTRKMTSNSLIQYYYAEFETYKESYPSLVISAAYYEGKIYFNLSNCIFSYDLQTGEVERLIEYNDVTAERDMTVAFGGMSFTKAETAGEYGVTLSNPPIAGLTIRNGEMSVDIASTLGYISGKKSHVDSEDEPEDTSSYGYMFEETNYNPDYLYASYAGLDESTSEYLEEDIDTDNDNDEFMWSANIFETIDMEHLTGIHSDYSVVTVPETCVEGAYDEEKCLTCGLIKNGTMANVGGNKNATHEYARFREYYYTKDDNGDWKTEINYVCIHCKNVAEEKPETWIEVDMDAMTFIWTWATDASIAACYRIPTELDHIKLDCVWENSIVGSRRRVADSITQTIEGFCDEGVDFVYTAKAGAVTGEKRIKQAVQPHQYVADEIQFAWAEDYTACDISYKCTYCGKEETKTCTESDIIVDQINPTCTVDGKIIYTAAVTLEGNTYSDSVEIASDKLALGHNYQYDEARNDEFCIRCDQVKPDSSLVLPENYSEYYTGEVLNNLDSEVKVEGSKGDVVITYYVDKECTTKTAKIEHGASVQGGAPSKVGVYYAKAVVEADEQYKDAESNVCEFVVMPNKVKNLKGSNVDDGVKLTWKKVAEATGYEIYKMNSDGEFEKIETIDDKTVVSYTDNAVEAGSTYKYDVRSYTDTKTGVVYCEANAKGLSIVHTQITTSNKADGVQVKWTKVPKATKYKVYRKAVANEDEYTLLATVDAAKLSYKDKKVKNGVKYYYYVKPDTSGTTNVGIHIYLKKQEIDTVTSPKAKQLKVSWNKNAKATGYRIRYSTSESFSSYKNIKVTSKDTLTRTIKSLKANKKYYVKVQSYKTSSGKTYYSAWSDVLTKKTKK